MWYLKSAFDAYQKVQDAVQSRLGDVQSAILSPVDMMKKFLGAAPASSTSETSELEGLRRKVADLEARLGKKTRAKRKKTLAR